MQHYDIVIIGGGLGGLTTARALALISPELAARTLVLEAVARPRLKGQQILTPSTLALLQSLEFELNIQTEDLTQMAFHCADQHRHYFLDTAWKLCDWGALDLTLYRQSSEVIEIHDQEPVIHLERDDHALLVQTPAALYRPQIVIAADGMDSIAEDLIPKSKVLETHILRGGYRLPLLKAMAPHPHRIQCDFSMIQTGLLGYIWQIQVIDQIYLGFVIQEREHALEDLEAWLKHQGLWNHEGWDWITRSRTYEPKRILGDFRIFLAGEAAGISSFFGDGLWESLEYGSLAAHLIKDAFEKGDFSFSNYHVILEKSSLGHAMIQAQRHWMDLSKKCPKHWSGFLKKWLREANGEDPWSQLFWKFHVLWQQLLKKNN